MRYTLRPQKDFPLQTDLLVVGLWQEKKLSGLARVVNRQLNGILAETLQREEFKSKPGEAKLIALHGKCGARYLLAVGLGGRGSFDVETVRRLGAVAVRTGNKVRAKKVSVEAFLLPKKPVQVGCCQLIAEGVTLGNYTFDHYKSPKDLPKKTVQEIEILVEGQGPALLERELERGEVIAQATNAARDLINIPASDLTPRRMVEEARKIGRTPHLSVKILDAKECKKLGMGGFLAVAKGSVEPPYLIHLTYRPQGKVRRRVALVGKGITFDSGGLSLKTAQGMETMKDDMSGAAAVLSLMKILPALKIPIEVHGIAAMTENMPSGSADKPGDVAKTMIGKTIEILNTDAEGRLTLADAIPYAIRQKPDLVIDIATLTGACVVALGELCSGIMGNDQKLINRVITAGQSAGEKLWQLPLLEEYKEDIKSSVADVKNVGGRGGGTITAGLFLQEFVEPKVPWAHIDIAGPSWTEKELDLCRKGGTGSMVRTLAYFLLQDRHP